MSTTRRQFKNVNPQDFLMKFSRTLLGAAATFALAASAQAALPAVVAACAITDITPNASGSPACEGFYSGQYLSGNPSDTAVQIQALGLLGYTWNGLLSSTIQADNQSGLAGATTIKFAAPLSGISFIGLHFGGGANSPTPGKDSTAFYRFDAGRSLSSLSLVYGASSDIKVYASNPVGAVPEPETYAMLLGGLGAIGFVARRRKQA